MNLDRAISELSRTIRERETWLERNGANHEYQYRLDAMKEALELVMGLRNGG